MYSRMVFCSYSRFLFSQYVDGVHWIYWNFPGDSVDFWRSWDAIFAALAALPANYERSTHHHMQSLSVWWYSGTHRIAMDRHSCSVLDRVVYIWWKNGLRLLASAYRSMIRLTVFFYRGVCRFWAKFRTVGGWVRHGRSVMAAVLMTCRPFQWHLGFFGCLWLKIILLLKNEISGDCLYSNYLHKYRRNCVGNGTEHFDNLSMSDVIVTVDDCWKM